VWRIYQPVPHLVAASVMRACRGFASPSATFAALYYLLLVLLPASLFLGARLMGLGPLAAGFAAVLIMSASGRGDFERYVAELWRLRVERLGALYGTICARGDADRPDCNRKLVQPLPESTSVPCFPSPVGKRHATFCR
jgi:hypothetical protein